MKHVITGSLGHISKPIVTQLIAAGHAVTVVTSKQDRASDIEALGATAAVGSVEDAAFVTETFTGADAVYLMIPPNFAATDWISYQENVADIYTQAIATTGVKKVVQLSSIGAHLRKGAGPVDALGYLEEKLQQLQNVDVLVLRPSFFFYNLFNQIDLVKNAGIFGANYGGDEKIVLVDTNDIADVAAEALLQLSFTGYSIQYIASDEATSTEIATVLGEAIGKPGTPWVVFSDEQAFAGMTGAGLPEVFAKGYVELGASLRSGMMQADYWKSERKYGKVKLADFAKAFAAAYNA